MSKEELKVFLINMKLVYEHGVSHSKNNSRLHRLLTLHNSHYVVEQVLREKAKDMKFNGALHDIGYKEIIKRVNAKYNIPDFNRLLELNSDRNGAEHFDNIPDKETINLYVRVVGDFLEWSYGAFFGIDYNAIAFEELINDIHIKRVMRESKASIDKGELLEASKKMHEALGALKFIFYMYYSDPRLEEFKFKVGDSLAGVIADLAFKIVFADDEATLQKVVQIQTSYNIDKIENGVPVVRTQSVYPIIEFKDKEEASTSYEEILNIILTYQDRIPALVWRKR